MNAELAALNADIGGEAGAAAPRAATVKNAGRLKQSQNRTLRMMRRAKRKEGLPANNNTLLRELTGTGDGRAAGAAAYTPNPNLVARLAALRGEPVNAPPAAPINRTANLERRLAALGAAGNASAAVPPPAAAPPPPPPGPARPGLKRINATRRLPGVAATGPATVDQLRTRLAALSGGPGNAGAGGPHVPPPAAPAVSGPPYPAAAELAKHLNVNPVPILFNVKNGQFKVSIPRAAGTRGALEICSPSLKGIRDAVAEDFGRGSGPQKTSVYGKMFGRQRVDATRAARRTRKNRK